MRGDGGEFQGLLISGCPAYGVGQGNDEFREGLKSRLDSVSSVHRMAWWSPSLSFHCARK